VPVDPATHDRFTRNIERVLALLRLYDYMVGERGRGRPPTPLSDILRASTVLLHASLEDLLRSIAEQYWPDLGGQVLEKVPLLGRAPTTRHTLADLVAHRGRTVQDVLRESVRTHLQSVTFNSTAEIAVLVESLNLDVALVNEEFGDIQEMIQRRHHIVHQADRNLVPGRGRHRAQAISEASVRGWGLAVDVFGNALVEALNARD
jgi:hypothetical protein